MGMHTDAACFVPTYFAMGMLGQITTGAIFFHEFEGMPAWRFGPFFCGAAVVMLAVYCLPRADYEDVRKGQQHPNGHILLPTEATGSPHARKTALFGPSPVVSEPDDSVDHADDDRDLTIETPAEPSPQRI